MSRSLPNYLLAYRKRSGLTQAQVARLLGCKSGAKVSRYERSARLPTLRTALAYEVISGQPVSELFRGLFEDVESVVGKRARLLARRLKGAKGDPDRPPVSGNLK